MSLADTSFIVASIIKADRDHERCIKAATLMRTHLVTTWPCITEAMHLLRTQAAQEKLRRQIEIGLYRLHCPTDAAAMRLCALMRQYADAPMDLADASLVVAAEALDMRQIFTLDAHFYAYLINGAEPFDVRP